MDSDPAAFPEAVSALWDAMDKGLRFGFKKLLRFNGGLFASTEALPLDRAQLDELLDAANREWSAVEPTIFGTLVERALSENERERLGAHFTPREYIERLIRPAILDPLREDLTLALGQARLILADASVDAAGGVRAPTNVDRANASAALRDFHAKLCKLKVLDPSCGSGNFLYVSFALLKELEEEVLRELADLGDTTVRLELASLSVNPSQFLGIELNPRAREIADLVLWIGYLQWHRRARGDIRPAEPVLRQYKNIDCRDAAITWDDRTVQRDEAGNVRSVWDMRTYETSPVTGELVSSAAASAQAPLYDYTNPRAVEWPAADFIVSNPPFCGNKPMRKALGDSYTEALRAAYPTVPKTADLVMYWWEKAAELVRAGKVRRFGLITTNSITQKLNRGVIEAHTTAKRDPLAIAFAIADHPWVQSGAAVRIAMTVGVRAAELKGQASLDTVVSEKPSGEGENLARRVELVRRSVPFVNSDLTGGANVVGALPLRANAGASLQGVTLVGEGFRVSASELVSLGYSTMALPAVVKPYMNARDVTQGGEDRWVIDLHGMKAEDVRQTYPTLYQRVVDLVKRERDHNKRAYYRDNWWVFGEPRPKLRAAVAGLGRYVVTPKTARHRTFLFVPATLIPDGKLYVFPTSDAYVLGILSCKAHVLWATAAGGWLGVGNDSTYNNLDCFDTFPFPAATPTQVAQIRALAEKLDAHRKSVLTDGFLAAEPAAPVRIAADSATSSGPITLTGMYNALERLREAERGGAALTYPERAFHDRALVGVLKSLHDDLDAAVAAAYGWDPQLGDEELLDRLVALNAERAAEEAAGTVRWLRPELQNPSGAAAAAKNPTLIELLPERDPEDAAAKLEWPKAAPAQLKAIRDAVVAHPGAWPAEAVARWFHNAQQRVVERHLRTLHDVGGLASYEDGNGRRWTAVMAGG